MATSEEKKWEHFTMKNIDGKEYEFKSCGNAILIHAPNAAGNMEWIEATISVLEQYGFEK